MTDAERYYNTMQGLHVEPTFTYTPDYRRGLKDKVSEEYAIYCEKNPDVTRDTRKKAYQTIHAELRKKFLSRKELAESITADS